MSTVRLKISGMHCGHCRTTVERALIGVAGVRGAAVDLPDGTADVDFDPEKAQPEVLVAAVQATGYDAAVVD